MSIIRQIADVGKYEKHDTDHEIVAAILDAEDVALYSKIFCTGVSQLQTVLTALYDGNICTMLQYHIELCMSATVQGTHACFTALIAILKENNRMFKCKNGDLNTLVNRFAPLKTADNYILGVVECFPEACVDPVTYHNLLTESIRSTWIGVLKYILSFRDVGSSNVLHVCISVYRHEAGCEDSVVKMVELVLSIDQRYALVPYYGTYTPFEQCCISGCHKLIPLLLKSQGDKLVNTPYSYRLPIFHAIDSGSLETVRVLINNGASLEGGVEKHSQRVTVKNYSPYEYAMMNKATSAIMQYLEDITPARIVMGYYERLNSVDSHGNTSLHRAISAGSILEAKTLVDKGADVTMTNEEGMTCYELALKSIQFLNI